MAARIVRVLLICTTSVIFQLIAAQNTDLADISLQFSLQPSDLIVSRGKQAVFNCTVLKKYEEPVDIVWFHNNTKVTSNENRNIYPNGTLVIKEVRIRRKKSHIGTYQCRANTSSVAILSKTASLRIAHMSNVSLSPAKVEVSAGESVRLACILESLPEAEITWTFQNVSILNATSTKYDTSVPGVLYIQAVESSDQGEYRCVASNKMYSKKARISSPGFLQVEPVTSKASSFNTIKFLSPSSPPFEKSVREGELLILECAVSGLWDVNIYWTFRARENSTNVIIKNETKVRKSILRIDRASSANAGTYTCRIVHETSALNENRTVDVNVGAPPVIDNKPASVSKPLGTSTRFTCDAHGYPPPVISWFHNGHKLRLDVRISASANELIIRNTDKVDAGIYQCAAVNDYGEVLAAAQLHINSSMKPSSPVGINCQSLNSSAIQVSWATSDDKESNKQPHILLKDPSDEEFDQNSASEHGVQSVSISRMYTVNYVPTDGTHESQVISAKETAIIGDLLPEKSYTIYVRTYNGASGSDASKKVTCKTGPKTDSVLSVLPKLKDDSYIPTLVETPFLPAEQNDKSLQIEQLNDTTVQVRWDIMKPVINNDEYKIEYGKRDGGPAVVEKVNFEQKSVVVYNLEPNTKYYISFKIVINGTTEAEIVTKSFQLPLSPPETPLPAPTNLRADVLSSTSMKVLWDPPSDVKVSYYTVFFSTITDPTPISVDSTSPEITINDLQPYYHVSIRVAVTDIFGSKSDPCLAFVVPTLRSEPLLNSVKNVRSQQLNSSVVRIMWTDPNYKSSKKDKELFVSYSSPVDRYEPIIPDVESNDSEFFVDISKFMTNINYSVLIHNRSEGSIAGTTSFIAKPGFQPAAPQEYHEVAGIRLTGEQFLGVLIGIGVGFVFIVMCVCSIYICKRRFDKRYRHVAAQPRVFSPTENHEMKIMSKGVNNYRAQLGNGCGRNIVNTQLPLLSSKSCQPNGHVDSIRGNANDRYYDTETQSLRFEGDNLLNSHSPMNETCLSVLDSTNERDHEGGDSGYCDRNQVQSPVIKDGDNIKRMRNSLDMPADDGFYEGELIRMCDTPA